MKLAVSTTVVAVAVTIAAPPMAASATRDAGPLEAARRAAEQVSFQGRIEVSWRDGTGTHREELVIEDDGGSLLVRGGTSVMAIPGHERLVQHGAEWNLLWPAGLETQLRPDAAGKYQIAPTAPSVVAGRLADVHEVRQRGALRERIYLDSVTGLLLRRDRFDAGGDVDRSVAFKTLTVGALPNPAVRPATATDQTPRVLLSTQWAATASPDALADGYQRVGAYRQTGVVHHLYSDGLYDLSVFEQPGRLDKADLPAGGQFVRVGEAAGWTYAWPGGHCLVWEAGPSVFTMVTDAPADQLLQAAAAVPVGDEDEPSLLTRLRHAAGALVAPFSD